jgi:hypothetical protein
LILLGAYGVFKSLVKGVTIISVMGTAMAVGAEGGDKFGFVGAAVREAMYVVSFEVGCASVSVKRGRLAAALAGASSSGQHICADGLASLIDVNSIFISGGGFCDIGLSFLTELVQGVLGGRNRRQPRIDILG